ncbi:hypothetical protein ACWD1Z_11860 [Streptomyces sp. NPDC002784]
MGMKGKVALGAVVGIVVIGAVSANAGGDSSGSGGSGDRDSSASADRGTGGDKKKTDSEEVAEKKVAFGGDGDFEVGSDIKPGTYRTTGNADGLCYWERAKDSSGEMDSLLANDNVTGTGYVTISASDAYFRTSGCQDWKKSA